MHTEIELKLSIANQDILLLQQHPLLMTCYSGPQKQKLYSIYFDTPDMLLTQLKMALRLRLVGTQWIQTLKGEGKVENGLHQRLEWEVPVARSEPDFEQLLKSPWVSVFTPVIQKQLVPIFVTDFWRTTWQVSLENGQIEVALDIGEVQANDLHTSISEVELELKSGDPESLNYLAKALQELVPLIPEDQSKADRGYQLFRGR